MSRSLSIATAVATLLASAACGQGVAPVEQGPPNVPDFAPAFAGQTRAPALASDVTVEVEQVAGGLARPWGLALLPEGGYLVTERPGRLRVVSPDGELSEPVAGLPEVFASGQGGLLDVALSPDFAADRTIFWTYSKPMGRGRSATAAARGVLSPDMTELTEVADIFVQEPPSPTDKHYGSRLVFDGAGHLYVTTGEHSSTRERVFAQDLDKTYGKVIRITLDGTVPEDNPFVGTAGAVASIWSYGHRNIQGAALDADGRLWITEHGPKGGDELNLVAPGLNYGWPVISYGENYSGSPIGEGITAQEGMEQPVYYWDPVIAPAGMAFYDGEMFGAWQGDLLVGAMSPAALVRLSLEDGRVTGEERLLTDAGRIRDVAVAPDGAILVITDQRDGALLRLTPGESS